MATGDVIPLAFVSRPPNGDNLLQFDTYEGGADLKMADAVMGAGRPWWRRSATCARRWVAAPAWAVTSTCAGPSGATTGRS